MKCMYHRHSCMHTYTLTNISYHSFAAQAARRAAADRATDPLAAVHSWVHQSYSPHIHHQTRTLPPTAHEGHSKRVRDEGETRETHICIHTKMCAQYVHTTKYEL